MNFTRRQSVVALLFGFLILITAKGQNSNISQQKIRPENKEPSAEQVQKLDQGATPNESNQLAILRAQLELAREYDGRILSTVYWALGVLAGVFVALIGFSWFVNFRVYERDKQAQLQELTAMLQREVLKIQESTSTEAQNRLSVLEKSVREEFSQLHDQVTSSAVNLRTELLELGREHATLQAEVWASNGQHGNAFSAYIRAANISRKLGFEFGLTNAIQEIEKLSRKMDGVFGTDIAKISKFLDTLENQESTQVRRLRDLLSEVKVL